MSRPRTGSRFENENATGFGPSKVFAADPDDQLVAETSRNIEGLTIGGIPLSRIPDAHLIPYRQTDQGIEEFNRERQAPRAQVTADGLDQDLMRRWSEIKEGRDPQVAGDPRRSIERHLPPGFEGRWLSPTHQLTPADRGFQVVKIDGDPLKLGQMIAGMRPKEVGDIKRAKEREPFQTMAAAIHHKHVEAVVAAGGRPSDAGEGEQFDRP